MNEITKVTDVEPLDGYWIRATFSDGAVKEIDLTELLARGGVFTSIRDDRSVFELVRVNPESETVEWPGAVDLDPEAFLRRARLTVPATCRRRGDGASWQVACFLSSRSPACARINAWRRR